MQNPRLAGRYAKSLLDLATELNQVDAVYADMNLLKSIGKSNPDFAALLRSPIIKPSVKEKVLDAVITSKINNTTTSFIRLLVRKGREENLIEIADAFIEQYNEIKGIYKVKLTTATPVSEELKNEIVHKVKATTPMQNIQLETAVKEELIGGFLLQMGGTLVDASILRDLNDIKKQFLDNQYIQKIR
ncbi:MAG: ATP synthase F1 subunit delta [Ferruginibacter sp.]